MPFVSSAHNIPALSCLSIMYRGVEYITYNEYNSSDLRLSAFCTISQKEAESNITKFSIHIL